jgi:SAM-dependent methyltransferase
MSVWGTIYERNVWAGSESLSGPGSGSAATRHVGPAIVSLVERYGITSVLDVGCGDAFWLPELPGYVGLDVSHVALERARLRHPERRYHLGDIRDMDVSADLVILRDVVQHLELAPGVGLVRAARGRGRYLLASTYRGGANVGCSQGALLRGWAYDNDLEAEPFSLGEPIEVIPDGYAYDGDAVRDPRKVLALWA